MTSRLLVLAANTPPSRVRLAQLFGRVVPCTDGCWEWTGAVLSKDKPYGIVSVGGERFLSHRLSYLWFVGDIPIGTELDHVCANKRCINPSHLEAVTRATNMRRAWLVRTGGMCKRGLHRMEGDNLALVNRGYTCRACRDAKKLVWDRAHGVKRLRPLRRGARIARQSLSGVVR